MLEPSSTPESAVLDANLIKLSDFGFQVNYQRYPLDVGDRQGKSGVNARSQALATALADPKCTYVLAARGGYGTSDLLRHLEWSALSASPALEW